MSVVSRVRPVPSTFMAYTGPLGRGESDLRAVWRPGRMLIGFQEVAAGQSREAGPVRVHHIDLGSTEHLDRGERDLRAIRGPCRLISSHSTVREPHEACAVVVHDADGRDAGESDPAGVR